jgi:hypothetical protein
MSTRISPGRLTVGAAVAVAAVWTAIGLTGAVVVGGFLTGHFVMIVPTVMVAAVAVLVAYLAGGSRGR